MQELEYLKKLVTIKEKEITSAEEKKKIELIKRILKNKNCFFQIKMESAIGILYFLGVPEEELLDFYTKLISPENYPSIIEVRKIVEK